MSRRNDEQAMYDAAGGAVRSLGRESKNAKLTTDAEDDAGCWVWIDERVEQDGWSYEVRSPTAAEQADVTDTESLRRWGESA